MQLPSCLPSYVLMRDEVSAYAYAGRGVRYQRGRTREATRSVWCEIRLGRILGLSDLGIRRLWAKITVALNPLNQYSEVLHHANSQVKGRHRHYRFVPLDHLQVHRRG